MKKYSALVKSIIKNLCGRGGFDDWWYNLDSAIQREIRNEMQETIEEWIRKTDDKRDIWENY